LSHILRFVIVVFYSSMEVAMYLRNILALVSHVVLYFLAATSSSVFGQQTFNGNTTFNGNVFMKGLVNGTTAGGGGPWFDVKAFGAKGDGVTNDRLAIQAAINAAGANTMAGSTTVMVGGHGLLSAGKVSYSRRVTD
jgi:Pectate lyase superfamily protein